MPHPTPPLAKAMLAGLLGLILPLGASAATDKMAPPPVDTLPPINALPDPFQTGPKARIRTRDQWTGRRAQLRDVILEYEYGRIPAETPAVSGQETGSEPDAATGATVHQITLKTGPGGKLAVPLVLTIPTGKGPFPIIIKGDLCWGRVKPAIVADVVKRGYILAEFDRTAVAPDKEGRDQGVYPLYPGYDWGALAAWSWGFSRVIDYVSTRDDVDRTKIIVTGHSRGGKATLLAGALDDRVALTVPNGSGAGGGGCFRVQFPLTETLQAIDTRFPYWFAPQFAQFIGHVDQLPFDQHELRALVAPRALLSTDSVDDLWANPMGTQISFEASREVYKFLGVPEKIGIHYRHGKHDQNEEDFAALLDFADWQLMGKQPAQQFDGQTYPNLPPAYKWAAPEAK